MNHLTADELAAWMDGTLSEAERSAAEAHASDCAQCQAMLAAMARTAPDVRHTPSWIGSVRWLVPIAAAAIVMAIWVGVTREPSPAQVARIETAPLPMPIPERESKPSAVAQLPPESRAKVEEAPPARDAKQELSKRAAPKKDRDEAAQSFGGTNANKSTADRLDAVAQNAPAVPAPSAPAPPPVSSVGQAAAATPAAPPLAPAEAQTAKPQALNETVSVTSEAPLLGGRAVQGGMARMASTPPIEVVSPERSYRWRALAPGSIQYSIDGGVKWRSSTIGTSAALRAGSAPSRNVCWLVGQSGLVLLTTDGQNWQVRPFPERIDLTGVSATDARNATVTTANDRRFTTADGGATWAPLQEN